MSMKVMAVLAVAVTAASCRPEQDPQPTPAPAIPKEEAASVPSGEISPMRTAPVSISAIVADPGGYAGKEVIVRGRCLGWRGPALGPQPRSRSDWQIGDDASALWVVGPFPPGCTGAAGGGEVTLRATVGVDTARMALGTAERVERAYLVSAR